MLTIGLINLMFLSSVFYKFIDGGYVPPIFAFLMVLTMFVFFYGYENKYKYDLDNKVSADELIRVVRSPNIRRVSGLAIFYTDLVQGITWMSTDYIANVPALHSVLVFVSIKSIPISHVTIEERFLFVQLESRGLAMYRCIITVWVSGHRDDVFEEMLVAQLKETKSIVASYNHKPYPRMF